MTRLVDNRIVKANELITFLRNCPTVQDTFLRGSLAKGIVDEFSDIDIGIDVSGYDNGEFAREFPSLLQRKFDVLFYDWSPSLLPKDYVITFICNGLPIFWIVDIQIMATPHYPSLTEVPINKYHHLLKLWILNLKYCLRGNEGADSNIKKLVSRTFNKEIESDDNYYLLFEVIKEIKSNVEPELHNFIAKCEDELVRRKQSFFKPNFTL